MKEGYVPYILKVDHPDSLLLSTGYCICGCSCQSEPPPYTQAVNNNDQASQWDYAKTA